MVALRVQIWSPQMHVHGLRRSFSKSLMSSIGSPQASSLTLATRSLSLLAKGGHWMLNMTCCRTGRSVCMSVGTTHFMIVEVRKGTVRSDSLHISTGWFYLNCCAASSGYISTCKFDLHSTDIENVGCSKKQSTGLGSRLRNGSRFFHCRFLCLWLASHKLHEHRCSEIVFSML